MRGPDRPRALVLRRPALRTVVYDLLAVPEPQTGDLDVAAPRWVSDEIDRIVALLAAGVGADEVDRLADARHPLRRASPTRGAADDSLVEALDGQRGLRRLSARDGDALWQVVPVATRAQAVAPPAPVQEGGVPVRTAVVDPHHRRRPAHADGGRHPAGCRARRPARSRSPRRSTAGGASASTAPRSSSRPARSSASVPPTSRCSRPSCRPLPRQLTLDVRRHVASRLAVGAGGRGPGRGRARAAVAAPRGRRRQRRGRPRADRRRSRSTTPRRRRQPRRSPSSPARGR